MALLKGVQMIWQEANVPSLSPPNCRASLLYWQIVSELISKLAPGKQKWFQLMDTYDPTVTPSLCHIADAHFHQLDQMEKVSEQLLLGSSSTNFSQTYCNYILQLLIMCTQPAGPKLIYTIVDCIIVLGYIPISLVL